MTYEVEFRSPNPVEQGGYRYWVERSGGKVLALRQPLKGDEPDPQQPQEEMHPWELPHQLYTQFETLSDCALPAIA